MWHASQGLAGALHAGTKEGVLVFFDAAAENLIPVTRNLLRNRNVRPCLVFSILAIIVKNIIIAIVTYPWIK